MQRVFFTHRVPPEQQRGTHAHQAAQQTIVDVSWSAWIDVTDGTRAELSLTA